MQYKTLNTHIEETHPWSEYIPEGADKLILGTFPTREENRAFKFFYPNRKNRFWGILSKLANLELSDGAKFNSELAVIERKKILDVLRLGISDIGLRVLRQNNSSSDDNLFPLEFKNIFQILDEYPSIETIIITSKSGANSVFSWFRTYCKINDITLPSLSDFEKNLNSMQIEIHNRNINIVIACSTSRATSMSEDYLLSLYRDILCK